MSNKEHITYNKNEMGNQSYAIYILFFVQHHITQKMYVTEWKINYIADDDIMPCVMKIAD